jgi:pimeloyl-ACP methyl ester carboxylesterase
MALIHHVVRGDGEPPVVLVHGFACAHDDWAAQIAHLPPRHQTIAVDLRGHGRSAGSADECSIERYGADVAEVMHALDLPPAVLVGHSMGCRVVIEAALQAPDRVAGVVLVDGSQFAVTMLDVFRAAFASPDGFTTLTERMFRDMFTTKSDAATAASVVARTAPPARGWREDAARSAALRCEPPRHRAGKVACAGPGHPGHLRQRKAGAAITQQR